MNWDAIGAFGEILGAIAVVATLIYLAKQLRQQNRANEGDAERDVLLAWANMLNEMWRDEQTSDLILRGLKDAANLTTPGERGVFHGRMSHLFSTHAAFFEMHQKGLLSDGTMESLTEEVAQLLASPGAAEWWNHIGPLYPQFETVEKMRKRGSTQSHGIADFLGGS